MNEATIDNALIAMKGRILSELDAIGQTASIRDRIELYHDFIGKLEFVLPLWKALTYGYKMNEIAFRICEAGRSIQMGNHCMHKTTHEMLATLVERAVKLGRASSGVDD